MRAIARAGRIPPCVFNPYRQMSLFRHLATFFFLLAFFLATGGVNASEGGEKAEGGGKDNLHTKLEPIVVNLLGEGRQYVQVEMVLKLAKPEIDEKIKVYMPVIRHKMILLLSSKDANQLNPIEGKRKLVMESKNAVNQALGLTDKEGVTEVLFDSFIIQ